MSPQAIATETRSHRWCRDWRTRSPGSEPAALARAGGGAAAAPARCAAPPRAAATPRPRRTPGARSAAAAALPEASLESCARQYTRVGHAIRG